MILGVSCSDKLSKTNLQSMGGLQRVEVMIMRRRLRWLGLVKRMKDCRLPKCLLVCKLLSGKRSVGGQKRSWNNVPLKDLNRCDLWRIGRRQCRIRMLGDAS